MKRIVMLFSILLLLVPFTALAQVDFCEGNFDYDQDQDGTDAFTFKTDFGRNMLKNPCPADGPAPVPKTGQTLCYDTYGIPRGCNGTGEDGEYQKGVARPNPRFTDHGNGTVTDSLTGLMWTKDAQQVPGMMTWQAALDACNILVYATFDDWRLPNVKELQSLIDTSQLDPALPPGHPFINLISSTYWSSTTNAESLDYAWFVQFVDGYSDVSSKSSYGYYAWPVRGGH